MKKAALAFNPSVKKTRKREFLDQMQHVLQWAALVEIGAEVEAAKFLERAHKIQSIEDKYTAI